MLTKSLLRARATRDQVKPALADPDSEALRQRVDDLLALFSRGVDRSCTRGWLQDQSEEVFGQDHQHKLFRGIAKVLLDRCHFEVESPIPPRELRQHVFAAARRQGPLSIESGPLERSTAKDVLTSVATELGVQVDEVERGLYADLKSEQIVSRCDLDLTDSRAVIQRYNLVLIQSLLLQATSMEVELDAPTVARTRQLFRYIKFHRLIHQATRDGSRLLVRLDGPASVLKQSTKYGLQLATFLPAVLLQDCPWTVRAELAWTKGRPNKILEITPDHGLVSHYTDRGGYTTDIQRWFQERFEAFDTPWQLTDQTEPIDLGGRGVVLPDYTLSHLGRRAHLDIIGFWRRDYLQRRLALLAEYGPGNLILAVSRKLKVDKAELDDLPGEIVWFSQVVPPREVVAAAERIARDS